MLTQMIKIGEEAGTLDSVLESTASFYDDEVDTATEQMTALIQPVIIVLLAVVIGFIIISILLPMFNMYDVVSNG
jgi:type IV pilus assembly protein PilC